MTDDDRLASVLLPLADPYLNAGAAVAPDPA